MKTPRGRPFLVAALAALAAAPALAAPAAETYYERSLMSAAGDRCRLFEPGLAAALKASALQARGAALRGGVTESELEAARARAEARAAGLACGSPGLAKAAGRVHDAFEGYARLWKMTFPGTVGAWTADRARPSEYAPGARWALSQPAAGGAVLGVVLDLEGRDLAAFVPAADATGASGARLLMRDPALAPSPYLGPEARGLAGRLPPRTAARVWLASGRGPAAAGLAAQPGQVFRFPASASEAMERLDPREAVAVELVFPSRDGERTRRILFEVGDFAAAQAFLAAR